VNCGFGSDKLLSTTEEGSNWIYKNKESGMMSATASLGMIHLWNVENGAAEIDKYTYSQDEYIKSGALMALGIVSSNVRNESDPALAILSEYVNDSKKNIRVASLFGYVFMCKSDV
jgi:26S proteasome regulatory subunit N1